MEIVTFLCGDLGHARSYLLFKLNWDLLYNINHCMIHVNVNMYIVHLCVLLTLLSFYFLLYCIMRLCFLILSGDMGGYWS